MANEQLTTETLFGTAYPKHHVVGMIRDAAEADRARQELEQAGFTVAVFAGEEVSHSYRSTMADRNPLERIQSLIPSHEQEIMEEHLRLAEEGNQLIRVHVDDDEAAEEVVAVLRKYGAQAMTRYDDMTLTVY